MMVPGIAVLVFLLLFVTGNSKRFPSYIKKCSQSDSNAKLCYIKAVNEIREHLNSGIPEFGLPPMDPLVLPEISLDSDDSFKASFKNVKIYHLNELKIEDINVNWNDDVVKIKLQLPHLRMTSDYSLQGKILFLQLQGEGKADGNFTNIEADVKLQAQRYKKESKEYLKFVTMEINEKLNQSVFRFEGLFKNNPELTEQTNKIINENIQAILDELRPPIHSVISKTVLGLISRIFEKFSIQELFLNSS